MDNTKWWNDKAFWSNIVTIIVLIFSLIRGVPVAPSVEQRLDHVAGQATVVAERTEANEAKLDQVQKQTKAVAAKVGAKAGD